MRDLGVCAIQLHGDMPRMHSADGEPEHEPHTVTDDSTVCITICDTKCESECIADGVTIGIAECESECESERVAKFYPKHES